MTKEYSPETLSEVARLKRDLEQYTRYGYEGIFLTKQWDELVGIVGDEEATAWYQTIEYQQGRFV